MPDWCWCQKQSEALSCTDTFTRNMPLSASPINLAACLNWSDSFPGEDIRYHHSPISLSVSLCILRGVMRSELRRQTLIIAVLFSHVNNLFYVSWMTELKPFEADRVSADDFKNNLIESDRYSDLEDIQSLDNIENIPYWPKYKTVFFKCRLCYIQRQDVYVFTTSDILFQCRLYICCIVVFSFIVAKLVGFF